MGDKVALDTPSGGAPNRAEELAAALEVSEDPTATDDGRDQQIELSTRHKSARKDCVHC
jgi:hypothetical protein